MGRGCTVDWPGVVEGEGPGVPVEVVTLLMPFGCDPLAPPILKERIVGLSAISSSNVEGMSERGVA